MWVPAACETSRDHWLNTWQLELQIIVNSYVDAGDWIQVLCESNTVNH